MEYEDKNGNLVYIGEERSINELLKIVLKEFKKGLTVGLCQVPFNLFNQGYITNIETNRIKEFLEENKPKPRGGGTTMFFKAFWFVDKYERIDFLEALIKKTE